MKKESQIAPVNSNLSIQKINSILKLTEKLSVGANHRSLVLIDKKNYEFQRKVERILISFIIKNFWFFIKDVKLLAEKVQYFSGSYSNSLLRRIEYQDLDYEYLKVGGFEVKDGKSITVTNYANASGVPILKETLIKLIISKLNRHVVGTILVHFANTSISHVIGYKINKVTVGNNVKAALK